jgi:SAM-dependent methyltransferase
VADDRQESGWEASAEAWLAWVDHGDPSRELLLDEVMLRECGDVAGRSVLDLGCGEGRFARMLGARGAQVTGLDITGPLLRAARERSPGLALVRATAERLPFRPASFDLVVSYVTLVDISDFRAAIAGVAGVLRPGGRFVVANLSFMSAGTGWLRDDAGRRTAYPLEDYLRERPVALSWAGIRVVNWHRPLDAYMQALLGQGLLLRSFIEPRPADDRFREDPNLEDWYRLPNFVVMAWERPAAD